MKCMATVQPRNPSLEYPREMKSVFTKKIIIILHECLLATSYTTAPNWKQPKRPSTGERLNNDNLCHGILLCSKNNNLLVLTTTWMSCQRIMLSGKKPISNVIYYTIPLK